MRLAATIMALAALATGCTSDPEPQPQPQVEVTREAESPPSPSPTGLGLTATGRIPGATLVVDSLARTDENHVQLDFTIDNSEGDFLNVGVWRFGDLGDGFAVSNVYLVDEVAGKRHAVARNGEGECLCSTIESIAEGESARWSAVFSAPPSDVTSMSVFIPFYPPINGVPIAEEGAAPPEFPITMTATGDVVDLLYKTESLAQSRTESSTRVRVVLEADVLFRFDSARLTPQASSALQQVAQDIESKAGGIVTVEGHTDSRGTDAYNQRLSERRAGSVSRVLSELIEEGIDLSARGLGERKPVAPNQRPDGSDNPRGRARNRRVEVTFAKRIEVEPEPTPSPTPPSEPTPELLLPPVESNDVDGLSLEILDLRRTTPGTVELRFGLLNEGEFLNVGADRFGGEGTLFTVGGTTLFDPQAEVRYLPVVDRDGVCICSRIESLDPGARGEYFVKFPEPPPEVQGISVDVPHFPIVDNVPVTR
jgi:outer membrane protein OmpA-like peptidoglycan-associated protein